MLQLSNYRLAAALVGAFLFLTVFSICVANEFTTHQTRVTLTSDAWHYFDTTRLLYEKLHTSQLQFTGLERNLADLLLLDGPVLPTMAVTLLSLLGKHVATTEWRIFVYLQSALHAAGSVIVYLLMLRVTRQIRWGLTAGLGWGLYPSAI